MRRIEFQPIHTANITTQEPTALQPRQIKDRGGCLNCKRRKVKCPDQGTPCRRCEQRQETCERAQGTAPTQHQWRLNVPRLPTSLSEDRGVQIAGADWSLLDYWFNRSCRLLCNETEQSINPFSSSLMAILAGSRAATHSIQSLSSAYREAFQLPEMRTSFIERGRALRHLRGAIRKNTVPTDAELFSIVIIGMSSAWFRESSTDVGVEHLAAAHAAITAIMDDRADEALRTEVFLLSAGLYIYWDMACSLAMPQEVLPTRDARLVTIAKLLDQKSPPSPVLGISTELFLLLGSVGRYTHRVLSADIVSKRMEDMLRIRLLEWRPAVVPTDHVEVIKIAECYRSTGLILLDRLQETDQIDDRRVAETFAAVSAIGANSKFFGFQTLILALVGSDISSPAQRSLITQRFFELYRYNRLPVNHQALELLQAAWSSQDDNRNMSVLKLMHQRGVHLMLG